MLKHSFDFEKFQKDAYPWFEKNFGPIEPTKSGVKYIHQPLLGIVEEVGELISAMNIRSKCVAINTEQRGFVVDQIGDAIGDIMIYMCDYCRCLGFPMSELENNIKPLDTTDSSFAMLIGSLCHNHLKMEQGIRGSVEDHLDDIKITLSTLITMLVNVCCDLGFNFNDVLSKTWSEVSKRDWTKNKLDGINQ